ncbi:MAG: hypothetical protein PHG02_03090 [Oscillospiraceae bacterium]|nr:hypothetical protein [Oscillospiraceae bacterium]
MKTHQIKKIKWISAILCLALFFSALGAIPVGAVVNTPVVDGWTVSTSDGTNTPVFKIEKGNKVNIEVQVTDTAVPSETVQVEVVLLPCNFSVGLISPITSFTPPNPATKTFTIKLDNALYDGQDNNIKLRLIYKKSDSTILGQAVISLNIDECVKYVAPVSTPPISSSAPVEEKSTNGLILNAYAVLDGNGNAVSSITAGQTFTIAVAMLDNRIDDSAVSDIGKQITVTPYSSSFSTPLSITIDRKTPVDGKLAYTVLFRGVTYGSGEPKFYFDISYSQIDGNGMLYPMDIPLAQQTLNVGQALGDTSSKVIIPKSITTGETVISAGSKFNVTATAFNGSTSTAIPNISVALGALPEGILVSGGSSSQFIGNVGPGGNITANFELQAQATLKAGSYKITVNYTSTDTDITATQDIMVTITQPERFEISDVSVPDMVYVGMEETLEVTLLNQGKGSIYNVSGQISGDNLLNPGQKQYTGNVEAGTEDSISFSLGALSAGSINGTVTITYENDSGEIKTLTKDFSCMAEEQAIMEPDSGIYDPTLGPVEENNGMPVWAWILIVVVIAAGAAGAFWFMKKKKAKAVQLEDDDEDI